MGEGWEEGRKWRRKEKNMGAGVWEFRGEPRKGKNRKICGVSASESEWRGENGGKRKCRRGGDDQREFFWGKREKSEREKKKRKKN